VYAHFKVHEIAEKGSEVFGVEIFRSALAVVDNTRKSLSSVQYSTDELSDCVRD
jgi:hypothetical protein